MAWFVTMLKCLDPQKYFLFSKIIPECGPWFLNSNLVGGIPIPPGNEILFQMTDLLFPGSRLKIGYLETF